MKVVYKTVDGNLNELWIDKGILPETKHKYHVFSVNNKHGALKTSIFFDGKSFDNIADATICLDRFIRSCKNLGVIKILR